MKRRSFLAMLGLAPVVSVPAVSASAQTPNDYLRETVSMYEAAKADWAVDVDALASDIEDHQKWLSEGLRAMEGRLDTHGLMLADA